MVLRTDDPVSRKKVRMDLVGETFGKLTVIEFAGINKHKQSRWKCLCECGNELEVTGLHLKDGHTVSCGRHAKYTIHGMTKKRPYRIWQNMKTRCENPRSPSFEYYGARGIAVCDEWRDSFEAFYEWALSNGYADNLTLDRIDVDGDYCPENCQWATLKKQQNNKRNTLVVELDGEKHALREWADIKGIHYSTLYSRYIKGEQPADILREPKGRCGSDVL